MKDAIVHAKPRNLAIVGAIPFAIAIGAISTRQTSEPSALFATAVFAGVALVLFWSWVVGHALNALVDVSRRPARGAFRVAVLFSAAYCAVFLNIMVAGAGPVPRSPIAAFSVHVAAMLAMLKVLHFIGLNLALAETEENADAAGSAWTTTLALFSIGGILPVQRRVNGLFERR